MRENGDRKRHALQPCPPSDAESPEARGPRAAAPRLKKRDQEGDTDERVDLPGGRGAQGRFEKDRREVHGRFPQPVAQPRSDSEDQPVHGLGEPPPEGQRRQGLQSLREYGHRDGNGRNRGQGRLRPHNDIASQPVRDLREAAADENTASESHDHRSGRLGAQETGTLEVMEVQRGHHQSCDDHR